MKGDIRTMGITGEGMSELKLKLKSQFNIIPIVDRFENKDDVDFLKKVPASFWECFKYPHKSLKSQFNIIPIVDRFENKDDVDFLKKVSASFCECFNYTRKSLKELNKMKKEFIEDSLCLVVGKIPFIPKENVQGISTALTPWVNVGVSLLVGAIVPTDACSFLADYSEYIAGGILIGYWVVQNVENVDLEQVKDYVDLEQVKDYVDLEQLKDLVARVTGHCSDGFGYLVKLIHNISKIVASVTGHCSDGFGYLVKLIHNPENGEIIENDNNIQDPPTQSSDKDQDEF